MMRFALPCILALTATPAFAQGELTYRARVSFEVTAAALRARSSPVERNAAGGWNTSSLLVAGGESTYDSGGRVRLSAALRLSGASDGSVRMAAREAYARLSVTPWMDVEAGKRIVRWGVGYGFSPTGVLDPPRLATDPTDRLGLHQGVVLARADLYMGEDTSLTIAAAAPRLWRESSAADRESIVAARLRSVIRGGVEVAAIASVASGDRGSFGATVTHVVGQRLEWHAEMLVHDAEEAYVVSAVAGLQYTFNGGVNMVVEYHRNGRGLDAESWKSMLRGERSPGDVTGRRNFLFLRAARASLDRVLSPELIVIAGVDDTSWTIVPALTWTPHARLQLYVRGTRLAGGPRSTAGLAPWSTSVTAGASVRF